MYRIILFFALVLVVGCMTPQRQEVVDEMDLEAQLDAYIDDYYNQVADLCIELHAKRVARDSVVDCTIRDHDLGISFPSKVYHDKHYEEIGDMYKHWCSAYGSKFGEPGFWVRYFRKENIVQRLSCKR